MKKLVLALTALAAFSGSALAADLPARTYSKAPVYVEPPPSWTGFYIFGGFGYGLWAADTTVQNTFTGACILCMNDRQGGAGWYGTVGAGYDWQVNQTWLVGILGDGQFGSISGSLVDQSFGANGSVGTEKLRNSYAAGARVGYLVAPNVLSYVNGGYSGSNWSGTTQVSQSSGAPLGSITNGFSRNGWFIGGGVENNLDIFGIHMPGLFMKTEYRGAYYGQRDISEINTPAGTLSGFDITFKPFVQTISTSLVYRFNWGGAPIAARY